MELVIPAGITEQEVKEWVAVLVERRVNAQLNANVEVQKATEKAKADIDTYRISAGLAPKFAKEPVKEEEIEPKDVPQG
jgi:hypothetical protein